MIVKFIVCEVRPERQEQFARGQEAWKELRRLDGFCGQVGGWMQANPNTAVIVAFWRDQTSYDRFMGEVHDEVFEKNGQKGTYTTSEVTLWNRVIDIPGTHAAVDRAVVQAGFIRLARCVLKPGREEHFLSVQREIWNPGMAAAGGMLAGVFNRAQSHQNHFLVCTLWRSESDHQNYRENHFADLRRRAEVPRDCESVTGFLVVVQPTWRVEAKLR